MAWYDFLNIRRSPPRIETPVQPRTRGFVMDLAERIEREEPFSMVHISVDRGDVGRVKDIVNGSITGLKGVVVYLPVGAEYRVYEALERLAVENFPSRLRVGSAVYSPNEKTTPGKLMVEVQQSYRHFVYEGRIPEQNPSPQLVA
jgi:hypothetical protein